MKRILHFILYWLARFILIRRSPQVIGITGSVGKTSTKDAIAVVLSRKLQVRATQENYNNEIGVPLTIIGSVSGGRNPFRWLYIFCRAVIIGLFTFLPYPEVLVLEMGVDKPGDLKYLLKIAPVDIGIVTAITETPAHLQWFKDVEQLAKEKFTMYKFVDKIGLAIINNDEPKALALGDTLKGLSTSIGIEQAADLMATAINFAFDPHNDQAADNRQAGLRFKFNYQGNIVPVFIPGVIGKPTVYSALFAAAVGLQYDINLVDISTALQHYKTPRGRMHVLSGINNSTIIDDSYNASPAAVRSAIITLQALTTTGRKIVCLGEMAELGKGSQAAHLAIGKLVSQAEVDGLIVVGETAAAIAKGALQAGLPAEAIQQFENSVAAGEALAKQLQEHDVLLVKGSQIARMEKTVKVCLAQPEQAEQLLVRQYGNWLSI
ncbi:MAG: hypothetical protein ACD_43C00203G0002 [uncultured bacterium]|nr:MAG: hypothetical protein ACD_43C00203G0002 [uncultured bacterium]